MPGLSLTLAQAGRLWSLDLGTCSEVLSQLVEIGFLSQRADGAFCRASDLAARPLRMAKAAIELVDVEQPRRSLKHDCLGLGPMARAGIGIRDWGLGIRPRRRD